MLEFASDEDPMLTLCEVAMENQTPVEYDNWWYCDGTSKALTVMGTDLLLPLPNVSNLPSSTSFYVFDVWVMLKNALPTGTELISLGAFSIWSDTADNLILSLKTPSGLSTMGSALDEGEWIYLKIWVKTGEIRYSIDNQSLTVLTIPSANNLQPTVLSIRATLGFLAKYLRLFSQEITPSPFDTSPAFSSAHLGDLGIKQLIADWPLNECFGNTVYDHSLNRQSAKLTTAGIWTTISDDPQPILSRTQFCEPLETCSPTISLTVGILLDEDEYFGCNLAGSVPTGPYSCSPKWDTQVWRSRSEQQYSLSIASPVSNYFGYEFSFWFSVNSFTAGFTNIISVGNVLYCLVDNANSMLIIQAKGASDSLRILFSRAIAYQHWYHIRITHHTNPPTLKIALSGQNTPLQVYPDLFSPISSSVTVSFGRNSIMSGFDGYLSDVIFYEGVNRYDWTKLWLYGHENPGVFTTDAGFKALLSFTLESNQIPDLIGSSSISLSSIVTSGPIFEVASSDFMGAYPDVCDSGEYFDGILCSNCNSSCKECSGSVASSCYKCASGSYFTFSTAKCNSSCAGLLQQNAGTGECLPVACFPNCGSQCTDVYHYACSLQCGSGLSGNGLGYCNGLFVNPAAGTSTILIPITASLPTGFMLEFWLYLKIVPVANQEVIQIGVYTLSFSALGSHLQLLIGSTPVLVSPNSLSITQWYHVFVIARLPEVQLIVYSQASDEYEFVSTAVFSGLYAPPNGLIIGGNSHSFNGFVAELRLWSVTSSSDISQLIVLFHSYLNSLAPYTVLYYPLVDGTSSSLTSYDQSSSLSIPGLVWQSATTPLSLCPDIGYFYTFDGGFARCEGNF
jgi:hypothetical protein